MRMKSALALSVLATAALCSATGYAHTRHQNFLLGGEMGYARQKENFNTSYIAPAAGLTRYPMAAQSVMVTDEGVLLGLLAGWQMRCHRWMFGIEGNVDFGSFEQNRPFAFTDSVVGNTAFSGNIVYDRDTIYGLTGRIGYFVTPGFMPYVRVGGQVSHDELNYQVTVTSGALPVPLRDFSSTDDDIYGVVAGIGVEFPSFIGPSTLRFEWTFSRTEDLTINDSILPVLGQHYIDDPHPETNVLKVAWVWNFM